MDYFKQRRKQAAAALERCEQLEKQNEQLLSVLRRVDEDMPNYIGGEAHYLSAGASYKVRKILYGNGGPRPE